MLEVETEDPGVAAAPVWAVFGDLMTGVAGALVLILLAVFGAQMALTEQLQAEVQRREQAEQRRAALEKALAGPLAAGRLTLVDGRIGISGSVLFEVNSDALQPEGRRLLRSLAEPLAAYLAARDEVLMVSGFTDDRLLKSRNRDFADNWELSAQRALTVTRTLIEAGVPSGSVFAAAFGAEQPVAPNDDAAGRARNRRVEIAPTPRVQRAPSPDAAASAP
jgi:flagellar motor protein MotB